MSADVNGGDPTDHARENRIRAPRSSEQLVTLVGRVALGMASAYLLWRAAFTMAGADAPAAWLLFGAEVLGVIAFALRFESARREPREVAVSPDAPTPDVAAVVDATGATIEHLRITLVSLRRVRGIDRVVMSDRAGSSVLRSTAERLGTTVMEADASFDDAVRAAGSTWVLALRAGDLPMPDLVSVCAPRCSAPEVAIVQVGVEEADPTSFEHDPDGRWSIDLFEHEVVRPSLARRGSIPFYGDGPVLLRRAVVSDIGSAGGHMLDDCRSVGLAISERGLSVTHVPLTLGRVRGPSGLGESLARRHRRTRSALAALGEARRRQVSSSTRFAHRLGLLPPLEAAQRLLLVGAAVAVLGFAQQPVSTGGWPMLALAVPAYGLRWTTHLLFGRGRLRPLSMLRSGLRSLGIDLRPFGQLDARGARRTLAVLLAVVVVLDLAVVVAAVSIWRDSTDRLPAGVAAVAFAATAVFLGVAMEVLIDAFARRQRRAHQRVRLGLVTCRIEERDGQLVDLSTGGAGIVVPAHPDHDFAVGDVTTVAFRIPDADGAWKSVSALVHVAHRKVEADGAIRYGLAFDDPTDAPLDPVVEFLTIDRRLVALGRHEIANR